MKRSVRITLRMTAALVLGAVTSAAVAWGIAFGMGEVISSGASKRGIMRSHSLIWINEQGAVGRRWRMIIPGATLSQKAPPEEIERTHEEWRALMAAEGAGLHLIGWGRLDREEDELLRRRQSAFGFPFVCLWYERSGGLSPFGTVMRVHGGYEISKVLGRQRTGFVAEAALPWRPAWAGLVLDAVVYGAGWLGVFALLARWRRRRAARRGKCAACGYDLRGLPAGAVCPECGAGQRAKAPNCQRAKEENAGEPPRASGVCVSE